MKSFTTANLCQEIVFRDKIRIWLRIARSYLAPSKPQPCDRPEPPAPNRNRMAKAARFWPIDLSDRLEPSNPNQDARPRPKQSAQPVPKTPNQATQPNARPDRSLRSPDPLVRVAYRTRPPSARLFRPESFGLATRLGPNRPAWLNRTVCLVEPNRPACTKNPAQIV